MTERLQFQGGIVANSFPEYWERIRHAVHQEFRRWVPELFGNLPEPHLAAVLRCLDAGKRIRGCLVCLTCEALNGEIAAAISRAVGIECIHAASLIHDDYVDGDAVRRHGPAEWTIHGARQAVLLGDVMFASAIHRMSEEGTAEGGLVAKVIATMAKGACQEHLHRSNLGCLGSEATSEPDFYDRIIHCKTGSLFGAAAQLGAMAATASDVVCAQSFTFGARLGEAYQIADDLADVVDLDQLPRAAAFSAAAPILLRFSKSTAAELLHLGNGKAGERRRWAELELPAIIDLMQTEIALRCLSAVSALAGFPDNPHSNLLREMPAQIVRSMDAHARAGAQAS